MNSQYIIIYNKVTVKIWIINRKSAIIITAVPPKHTMRWTVTRVALGTIL